MFTNNSQNNSKNVVNVNTRSIQFRNKEGFDPSALSFGFWNEFISIKINPALDKNKQTESKVFDYETTVSTALTAEKVTILINDFVEILLPALKDNKIKSIGVPVGASSLFVIATGNNKIGSNRPYVGIYKNLNEETKKPEMSICYEFNRSYRVDDYNEEEGTFEITSGLHSELLTFMKLLKSSRDSISNGAAHSIRYADKGYRDASMKYLEGIGKKHGIEGRTYGKQSNVFSNSNSTPPNNETNDISNIENLESIDQFM